MSTSNPLSRFGAAAVVGAGIAGATVAYELARRGVRTTLFEQRSIAYGASGRNMGLLLNQVEPEVVRIMGIALDAYRELESSRFGLRQQRQLLLARDSEQADAAAKRAVGIRGLGVSVEEVDGAALRTELPQLSVDVLGGWVVEGAWALDPGAATLAFVEAARAAGAEVLTGTRVHTIVEQSGRVHGVISDRGRHACDAVVVATGPWLPQLAPGVRVTAARGWVLRTAPLDFTLPWIIEEMSWPDQDVLGRVGGRPTLADLARGGYDRPVVQALALCQVAGGEALLGTSMAQSLRDAVEGVDMPQRLAERALLVAPGLASLEVGAAWSGMRPLTPDGMPVAGPVAGSEGLFVHGGHGSIGMMTAPATARWLVEGNADELAKLDPARFELGG
ncbi:MAG TPA: FAD-dependent oxidoreductase [Candidatus Dormibacteraeota bacterium]